MTNPTTGNRPPQNGSFFGIGIETFGAVDFLTNQCGLVRELSLFDMTSDSSITRLLASLKFLPQLRVLALDISHVHNFRATTIQRDVADGIMTFLESRRRLPDAPELDTGSASGAVELESFTLHAPRKEVFDFTAEQHERIKALRASGLILYIFRYATKDPRTYE